jgi:hypothetical protein
MPNRFSAAAMAASPSITATLPQVGEQLRDLVSKTDVTQFRPAEGICGQFLKLGFTSANHAGCW